MKVINIGKTKKQYLVCMFSFKILNCLDFNYLFVCLFVFNKSQNGRTDHDKIFVGPNTTPGKVYRGVKIKK